MKKGVKYLDQVLF